MKDSALRDRFERDGYVHVEGVFDEAHLAELDSSFDRILSQLEESGEWTDATWGGRETERLKSAGDRVLHTHQVQQYSAAWLRALMHPRFLDCAEALIGPDIVLHHSKLFHKPAGHGSPFPMHQDWSYFPTLKDSMIAAVIHVSDATEEMGCLRVEPGSHRLGRAPESHGQQDSELLKQYPLENATPLPATAGDVVFFSYFTLHGSGPNRSQLDRKTVLVQLHAGNDRVEEDGGHPDSRLVLRGWSSHATRDRAGRAG